MNIQLKQYTIPESSTITNNILSNYVDNFWSDVFKSLHTNNSNIHLMVMVKVEFTEPSLGNRSLCNMRKVNFNDNRIIYRISSRTIRCLSGFIQSHTIFKICFFIPSPRWFS